MKCPIKTPVRVIETNGSIVDAENEMVIKVLYRNQIYDLQVQQLHYAAKAINSYEKLKDLADDLKSGLSYLRDTNQIPYGFGIDRLEEKLQALKEAEKL